jgi:hypothetical protein
VGLVEGCLHCLKGFENIPRVAEDIGKRWTWQRDGKDFWIRVVSKISNLKEKNIWIKRIWRLHNLGVEYHGFKQTNLESESMLQPQNPQWKSSSL